MCFLDFLQFFLYISKLRVPKLEIFNMSKCASSL